MMTGSRRRRLLRVLAAPLLLAAALVPITAAVAAKTPASTDLRPTFTKAAAVDTSPPLRDLASARRVAGSTARADREIRPDRGPVVVDRGHTRDTALQTTAGAATTSLAMPSPLVSFDGANNTDNFNTFGFRVNPPDPVGDVGPNHYVEMINLVFSIYSKTGTLLLGPVDTGTLWAGFAIDECTEPSGDPIVIYDQLADRWVLSQFTTRGINYPSEPLNLFYECVAISTSGDPTGSYHRYAFSTGYNFPDYPKLGLWRDTYVLTTREFGILDPNVYGIGVYGLDRAKMLAGDPTAMSVGFLLDTAMIPINLVGDGLLPPDLDGSRKPHGNLPAPVIGTQDDGGPYGATFDAVNVWEFDVAWQPTPTATIGLAAQLPVAGFDSVFPCAPTARDCLPQPGIANPAQYLDHLGYRQRPIWRLAFRNVGPYETMVTTQAVEAAPAVSGMRWYEVRRDHHGDYSVYQQGTYAPSDGVHRWMGSIAMDGNGNMALGYSVVNGVDVYPGIRYTGRLNGDTLGEMTLGEATAISGTGVQTTANSRWGDYTSMNVDPVDDCTFWYVNEYYTAASQTTSAAGWLTRISSFKIPGCLVVPDP